MPTGEEHPLGVPGEVWRSGQVGFSRRSHDGCPENPRPGQPGFEAGQGVHNRNLLDQGI